ncbi:MAG: CBS domain-containing protein [Acidobacteria bacterium]|nr:CBS domain-containing protein [Acidobacteriota bacterium]
MMTVESGDPADAALATMRQHRIRHLVVVENGRLAGIVSERDLGGARGAEGSGPDRAVRDLMTPDPVTASPATTLRQAANLMRGQSLGSLLVVDDGHLVGIVTTTDLLDQLGRGGMRPTVRTEPPPLRRPPGSGIARGRKAPRAATGPRRGRRHRRTSAERSALPSTMPRAAKHVRGRTLEIQPPGHIRVLGAALDSGERADIARKLGMRLGKFASSIERVTVRLSDVNGPKGGVDHRCLIKAVLSGLPSVVVERRDAALQRAVNASLDAIAQAIRRSVQRRRLKPRHRRRPRPQSAA